MQQSEFMNATDIKRDRDKMKGKPIPNICRSAISTLVIRPSEHNEALLPHANKTPSSMFWPPGHIFGGSWALKVEGHKGLRAAELLVRADDLWTCLTIENIGDRFFQHLDWLKQTAVEEFCEQNHQTSPRNERNAVSSVSSFNKRLTC